MILSRDLLNVNRVLLLKANTVVTAELVERIRSLAHDHLLPSGVFVKSTPEVVAEEAA